MNISSHKPDGCRPQKLLITFQEGDNNLSKVRAASTEQELTVGVGLDPIS